MHYNYFLSDPHFSHTNILSFKDENNNLIRGKDFSSIEEHDNTIIENINKKVRVQDKLYILGDITFKKRLLGILSRINTKKLILIKGNHDTLKLNDYALYFKDIRAYKTLPEHKIVFSHIPVHESQLSHRFKYNVHGHLHHNTLDDKRYFNICPECIGYEPLELEEILQILKKRGNND